MLKIRKKSRPIEGMDIVAFVSMTLLVLMIAFPFYNAIITSLMTSSEYTLHPVTLWPKEFTLDGYKFLIGKEMLLPAYKSSVFITLAGTALSMVIGIMMAYGFSRPSFPGKKILFRLVLLTMFFGGGMIPTYMLMKNLKLIDSHWGIILLCGVSTYNIILMKNSFEQTPEALLEAARIDGSGELRIFLTIVLPLQLPLLATFTLFVAVAYWNEWFWSMLIINTTKKQTLQLMLRALISEATSDREALTSSFTPQAFSMGIKMAAVVVTMLPVMVLYPFVQKYFVKGLLVGAIKT